MAKFCTSCGSPVEEGVRFCPKCGAQLGAAPSATPSAPSPAPAQPSAAAPAPAAPTAAAPAATPSGSGSKILKIVIGVLAFIFVVSLLGIGACVYIGYRAKQRFSAAVKEAKRSAPTWSTSTPEVHAEKGGEGSEAAASATEDVPPYPGSTATKSGGGVSIAGINLGGQEYETSDSVDQVVGWYKGKLGSKINVQVQEGKATFTLMGAHGLSTVTISREEGAEVTKINIARMGR